MPMKSTIVIYAHECERSKADAKRIAYLVGAQTTCTRRITDAIINNVENFILCVQLWEEKEKTGEWDVAAETLQRYDLKGKNFAIFVNYEHPADTVRFNGIDSLNHLFTNQGARLITLSEEVGYGRLDDWICALSPSL